MKTQINISEFAGTILRPAQTLRYKNYLHTLDALAFMHQFIFVKGTERLELSNEDLSLFRGALLLDEIESTFPLLSKPESQARFQEKYISGYGHDVLHYMFRSLETCGIVMKSVKDDEDANAWTDGECVYENAEIVRSIANDLYYADMLIALEVAAKELGMMFVPEAASNTVYQLTKAELKSLQRKLVIAKFKHQEQYLSKEDFEFNMFWSAENGDAKLILCTLLDALQMNGLVLKKTGEIATDGAGGTPQKVWRHASAAANLFQKRFEEKLLCGFSEALKKHGYDTFQGASSEPIPDEVKYMVGKDVTKHAIEYIRTLHGEADLDTGLTKFSLMGLGNDLVAQLLLGLGQKGISVRTID